MSFAVETSLWPFGKNKDSLTDWVVVDGSRWENNFLSANQSKVNFGPCETLKANIVHVRFPSNIVFDNKHGKLQVAVVICLPPKQSLEGFWCSTLRAASFIQQQPAVYSNHCQPVGEYTLFHSNRLNVIVSPSIWAMCTWRYIGNFIKLLFLLIVHFLLLLFFFFYRWWCPVWDGHLKRVSFKD